MTTDLLNRKLIVCPTCCGSRKEPSVITTYRRPCSYCGGGGYFHLGEPTRLATIQEFNDALRSRSTNA